MSIFSRRRKGHSADPREVVAHLTGHGIASCLEGTEATSAGFAQHLATDLAALDRETLAGIAGLLIIEESHRQAIAIREGVEASVSALLEAARREAAEAVPPGDHGVSEAPAPTDLLDDAEPVSAPQEAAEGKVWTEDRT